MIPKSLGVTNATKLVTSNEEWSEKSEKKRFDERRTKKAYIAWDDNDSSDGSEKEINLLTKDYESDENISQELKARRKSMILISEDLDTLILKKVISKPFSY